MSHFFLAALDYCRTRATHLLNYIISLLEFVRVLCTESGTAVKEAGSTKKKKKKLKSKAKKGTSGATVTIASSIAVTSSHFAKTSSDKVDLQYIKRLQKSLSKRVRERWTKYCCTYVNQYSVITKTSL